MINAACRTHLDPTLLRIAWAAFHTGAWDGARTLYSLWLYEIWSRKIVAAP